MSMDGATAEPLRVQVGHVHAVRGARRGMLVSQLWMKSAHLGGAASAVGVFRAPTIARQVLVRGRAHG